MSENTPPPKEPDKDNEDKSSQAGSESEPIRIDVSIPPAFSKTIIRAQSMQEKMGLSIQSSITPQAVNLSPVIAPKDSTNTPVEKLGKDGFRISLDEEGQLLKGLAEAHVAYEVQKVIGRGGMGIVCQAIQKSLNRPVALKIARKASGDALQSTKAALDMFTNEAYITASLDHPNVVPVHTLAKDPDGKLFFTMKQVTGTSWEDLLSPAQIKNRKEREEVKQRSEKMELKDHLEILLEVSNALAYAHAKGVIHRDVKPENVMIGSYGEVLLMDWGLAMPFGDANPYKLDPSLEPQLVGTPAYLAPEMARGQMTSLGPATDVYLMGATLYRVLTGRAPHWGEGIIGAVNKAASGKIEPPEKVSKRQIDAEISRICLKALKPRISDRFKSMKDFQLELRQYMDHAESLAISQNAIKALDKLQAQLTENSAGDGMEKAIRLKDLDKSEVAIVYGKLNQTIGAFKQSLDLWKENQAAQKGLIQALLLQVAEAIEQEDLTLAKTHLDMLEETADALSDQELKKNTNKAHKRLAQDLSRRLAIKASYKKREKLFRATLLALLLLALGAIVGAFYLILEQKNLALENLQMSNRQKQSAETALRLSKRMHRMSLAGSVSNRAAFLSEYLFRLEQIVQMYQRQASRLLNVSMSMLPPRKTTSAGRKGFYMDEDFSSKRTSPKNMVESSKYHRRISMSFPTVKLAPWAMRGVAKKRAMRQVTRLSRIDSLMSDVHDARSDILWSVIGTSGGALISFPGFERFSKKPDYDPTKRPWYEYAMKSENDFPHWADPHVDAGGHGLLLTCVAPVEQDGKRVAVVGAEISMQFLQEIMLEFAASTGTKTRALLLRPDGVVIADSTYSWDAEAWKEKFELHRVQDLDPAIASYWAGAKNGQVPQDEALKVETSNGNRLLSHSRLSRQGWIFLAIMAPTDRAKSKK